MYSLKVFIHFKCVIEIFFFILMNTRIHTLIQQFPTECMCEEGNDEGKN